MEITYSPKLKEYMEKKGLHHIAVELADSETSTCGFVDISTRFVKDNQVDKVAAKARRVLEGELGNIYVLGVMDYDDAVELDLRSFFGLKDITVKGIRAWTM